MKIEGNASISTCGRYRWSLSREWGGILSTTPWVGFIMLNPSTAGWIKDDPTIRRCIAFAQAWGYSGLTVRNLFNFRTSSPAECAKATDPIGMQPPHCDNLILGMYDVCNLVIAAWGAQPFARTRAKQVCDLLAAHNRKLHCLAVNADGSPKHPLYCKADLKPIPYGV